MKVLLFANTDWFLYNFRLGTAQAMKRRGDEVVLLSPPGRYTEKMQALGFRWVQFDMSRRGANPLRELGTLLRLVRLYRRERPGVVHHFTIKCVLYGTIAARLARVPVIVNSLTGLGYVFTGRQGLLRRVIGLAYRLLVRHTATIFENPWDRELFRQRGWIEEEISTVILGAGVDLERFRAAPEPEGPVTVVFPARILWDKGAGEFVEAARMLRARGSMARFVLVGEPDPGNPTGVPLGTLEDWRREGVVEYQGWREEMEEVYAAAHIVCLPSYREGLPKALAEAAAAGRPIVTTDVPGCRDVVEAEVNGLLVPARQAAPLALALERLIEDPALRQRMGAAGRQAARSKFEAGHIAAQTLAFYDRLSPRRPIE
jgi:glycosyltransferase involved in cell wall biosynthesis